MKKWFTGLRREVAENDWAAVIRRFDLYDWLTKPLRDKDEKE